MEDLDIHEILRNDPFETQGPDNYEQYLYTVVKLAWANIAGLTEKVEHLATMIKEHERLHTAANVAAMKVPDITKDDKVN